MPWLHRILFWSYACLQRSTCSQKNAQKLLVSCQKVKILRQWDGNTLAAGFRCQTPRRPAASHNKTRLAEFSLSYDTDLVASVRYRDRKDVYSSNKYHIVSYNYLVLMRKRHFWDFRDAVETGRKIICSKLQKWYLDLQWLILASRWQHWSDWNLLSPQLWAQINSFTSSKWVSASFMNPWIRWLISL